MSFLVNPYSLGGSTNTLLTPATASLLLSGAVPLIGASAVPGTAALTLSGVAPDVAKSIYPTDISGLQLWLDFTDAGTQTIVASQVTQITDKSGNGRTATVPSLQTGPLSSALCPNGAIAADFDGGRVLTTSSFSVSQPFTIIIVGKNRNTFGNFHDSPSGTRIAQLFASDATLSNGGTHLFGWAGSGNGNGDTSTGDTNVDLISCFIGDGASSKMFVNNVQRGTTGQGSATAGISTGLTIGNNHTYGGATQGYIAHVLVYDSALITSDRRGLETFLKNSTGISF